MVEEVRKEKEVWGEAEGEEGLYYRNQMLQREEEVTARAQENTSSPLEDIHILCTGHQL